MKKWLWIAVVGALLPFLQFESARAGGGISPYSHWEGPEDPDYAKKMDHWNKTLHLTPDQAQQMETIIKDRHEKMKALHEETKTKGKTIWEEADTKINNLLTPDQQTLYKQEMEKKKNKMKAHHAGKNGSSQKPRKEKMGY